MLLWFLALGAAGVRGVAAHPSVLRGLSPSYAAVFIADRPYTAFIAMGAVVLAITGAEALYADLSHFGRPPIRLAWFLIVFPALTLNYLAQGRAHPARPVGPREPVLSPRAALGPDPHGGPGDAGDRHRFAGRHLRRFHRVAAGGTARLPSASAREAHVCEAGGPGLRARA